MDDGGRVVSGDELGDLMEAGTIAPVVDRTYPFRELPDAVRYLETGRARGKVVVTVAE